MGLRTVVVPAQGARGLTPIDSAGLHISSGLLADRLDVNRTRSLPHGRQRLEASGALGNFRNAARGTGRYIGGLDDAGTTFPFLDSDVYKWLEAAAWELGRDQDVDLAASADTAIELVAAAQSPDGYLNTYVQLSGRPRWSDLRWGHELYCIGHLIQAAVAWYRALDDDRLLQVAVRAVEAIDAALGPSGAQDGVDGHPGIEMALVELYRMTGQERHLALARHLIDRRGHGLLGEDRFGSGYWQDGQPVREAATVVGHAVRQLYLDCGAVDLAVETGETALLDAVIRRWDEMRATRTYLTGGVGSHHRDEAFGAPFELPPDRAYTETCAAIASLMLAWRLLLATGQERFADAIERAMYDAVLPGLSLDGLSFFYVNPLQRRPAVPPGRAAGRKSWYPCACCPPNVMRTIASFEQLMATTDDAGLRLHQYATGSVTAGIGAGPVTLNVETDYPWDGRVEVTVDTAPREPWTLGLRVPAWCHSATLSIEGEEQSAIAVDGHLAVERAWRTGDRVVLDLAMPARYTIADPRLDGARGCVAVERGPLVYCLEAADLTDGVAVDDVMLDTGHQPRVVAERDPVLGTVPIEVRLSHRPRGLADWPYRDGSAVPPPASGTASRLTVRVNPYYAWANRGDGPMRVWVPDERSASGSSNP